MSLICLERKYFVDLVNRIDIDDSKLSPIRKHFLDIINYIYIIERNESNLKTEDIFNLIAYIETKKQQCEMYLKYMCRKN